MTLLSGTLVISEWFQLAAYYKSIPLCHACFVKKIDYTQLCQINLHGVLSKTRLAEFHAAFLQGEHKYWKECCLQILIAVLNFQNLGKLKFTMLFGLVVQFFTSYELTVFDELDVPENKDLNRWCANKNIL